jgi:hypothetical protein
MTRDRRRQLVADPLTSFAGCVNGVYAWAGLAGQEPPPRPPPAVTLACRVVE